MTLVLWHWRERKPDKKVLEKLTLIEQEVHGMNTTLSSIEDIVTCIMEEKRR